MICISSNRWSHDQQVEDAVDYLRSGNVTLLDATPESFDREFPEWGDLVWSGSWVDAEESGVDPDYMSWVTDWIEEHTLISWHEGEPVIFEAYDADE